jgi:hypothetical protein
VGEEVLGEEGRRGEEYSDCAGEARLKFEVKHGPDGNANIS